MHFTSYERSNIKPATIPQCGEFDLQRISSFIVIGKNKTFSGVLETVQSFNLKHFFCLNEIQFFYKDMVKLSINLDMNKLLKILI